MKFDYPSRRTILKASGLAAGLIGMPALVRAETKELVIGGPAGASKYFNSDLFPFLEKKNWRQDSIRRLKLAHQSTEVAGRQSSTENVGRNHG